MSGLVAAMVTIGGITRLTRSGLSMTDWKLQGNLPPITLSEWEIEFERYKQFPEWQQRKNMTLDEFKFIYYWEYGHRMMGRALGFAFAIPGAYFAARGMIPKRLYPRVALLFGLGGTQGLIGWWMVKSGLNVDPAQRKEIRVSPYRLTTHLTMAFTTYGLLLWTAMDILHGPEAMRATAQKISAECMKHARKIRAMAAVSAGLAAVTIVSGAFVAGNDAGMHHSERLLSVYSDDHTSHSAVRF
jgi:cytochrome c oxidase assembly protein subunit 15